MTKTAPAVAFLLALSLMAPLEAAPAAATAPLLAAPEATLCPAPQPAAAADLEKIARPQNICPICPMQAGEQCLYEGQECGLGSGCTCQVSGPFLDCCQ